MSALSSQSAFGRRKRTRSTKHRSAHLRSLGVESLETRCLLSGASFVDLPAKVGQEFVIDDWNNVVTKTDFGVNYFGGATGPLGDSVLELIDEFASGGGGSLEIASGTGQSYGGYFTLLGGRNQVEVTLDPTQDASTVPVPDSVLDLHDIYDGFEPMAGRSAEQIQFDVKHNLASALEIRVELKNEAGGDAITPQTKSISSNSGQWQTVTIDISTPSDPLVQVLALVIEDSANQAGWSFQLDNLRLVDTDGSYPDMAALAEPDGTLASQHEAGFLDYVRYTSAAYFVDRASHFDDAAGIIQDRATFPDLMTVGGTGFQLTSYVIDAEQGYLSRDDAAIRVRDILRHLQNSPQGPGEVGTIGYEGFFYHFLGTDGLRKQNPGGTNTVELSPIDTALAMAGVLTAGQYFNTGTPVESEIRALADSLYGRINWDFMLYTTDDDPGGQNSAKYNQFYLGWKPNNSDPNFRFPNPNGPGFFSGTPTIPQTIDFYTDEGLLIALLAMASPSTAPSSEVWYAMQRESEGGPFVKTFPGSLFTYQFFSLWVDTEQLGPDNHPTHPVDFHENSKLATDAARDYTIENPLDRVTWQGDRGEYLWGVSAAEGPFDTYFAEAAPPLAIADMRDAGEVNAEGEDGTGDGIARFRSNASGGETVLMKDGDVHTTTVNQADGYYNVFVAYSNDGPGENVTVTVDGTPVGSFVSQNTRPASGNPGDGWNNFFTVGPLGSVLVSNGSQVKVAVTGGDPYGIEIDRVILGVPTEVGTTTVYGAASSIAHQPEWSITSLWESARLHENYAPLETPLLHPRFGFADALNLDIADAAYPGSFDPAQIERDSLTGPWAHHNGFAIDQGPIVIAIDNYLENQFVPSLFMAHPAISSTLHGLFPNWPAPETDQLYFSLRHSADIGGLSVANEDIVAYDGTDFRVLFDGSDVGLNNFRIDAFSVLSDREILISFERPVTLPDVGQVDDSDIVRFRARQLGEDTEGMFSMYFDGSDVGLTNKGEDIDGLEVTSDGKLLISTHGPPRVPGVTGDDEDILLFDPTSLGANTAGTWAMYFDGSDVGLGTTWHEDVNAMAIDANGNILLSTLQSFAVPGVSGSDEDVFSFTPSSTGNNTAGAYQPSLFFDGSAFGLSNDIYGIDVPSVPLSQPASASDNSAATDLWFALLSLEDDEEAFAKLWAKRRPAH